MAPKNPDGAPDPTKAIPLTEPNWDSNENSLPPLEHYKRHILEGLKKGVPKHKNLIMVQAVQQKPAEDNSGFLERIYQACRKYTNLDTLALESIRMVI